MRRCLMRNHFRNTSRLIIFLILTVLFSLMVIQWKFHTFTNAMSVDRIAKNFGGTGSVNENPPSPVHNSMSYQDKRKMTIESLSHQISDLQQMLQKKTELLDRVKSMPEDTPHDLDKVKLTDLRVETDAEKVAYFLKKQVNSSDLLGPHGFRNEYEVTPFTVFTRNSLYQLELGLSRHPELAMAFHRDRHADVKEAIDAGIEILNKDISDKSKKYLLHDFIEGQYRLQQGAGMHYELTYQHLGSTRADLQTVSLFRPFGPIHAVGITKRDPSEVIYFIMPLQGRVDSFRTFMDNFKKYAIHGDGNVHLTVVCYGQQLSQDVSEILKGVEQENGFKSYQIIPGVGNFARGRALQDGTKALPEKNVLMFFCDVDISFTKQFLTQCRTQTLPGRRVFYPVVFSLYNPEIVYEGKTVPSMHDQQIIKNQFGFWRDFGFGMTCQYKDDFNKIGGFDLTIKGWGTEDVLLYRRYVRSPLFQVIRAPVYSLFHHWHPKHCDSSLSLDQYNACLKTKSLTEGSQIQLGMLYLKDKEKDPKE